MPEFTTFSEFVMWLVSGPGLVMAVGALVSYVLEKFDFWTRLPKDIKTILTLALPFVLAFSGVTVLLHMGVIVKDAVLDKLFTALLFYFASQFFHIRVNQRHLLR